MRYPYTGVILAGGMNSRFSGANKAFIRVGGRRILDRIYDLFQALFEEIVLVTNDPLAYLEWDAAITTDLFPVRSSLTGLHAGLFAATRPFAFFTACDTPFLSPDLVAAILDRVEDRFDLVVPRTSAGFEPLCAAYSRRCLAPAADRLSRNRFKIMEAFKRARTRTVSEKVLREADPELRSFFNINTPAHLAQAEAMLREQGGIER